MPPFGPISQKNLIQALRRLGFTGPVSGSRHPIMVKGTLRLHVPNPHQGDIGRDLLVRILRQAGVSRDDWEAI